MATRPTGIHFETYADAAGEWRWRMVDGNNRIVAVSGEGFTRERDAKRACENILTDLTHQDLPVKLLSAKQSK